MELGLDELRDGCVGLPCFVVVLHVAYTHDIPFPLWQPLPCFVVASLFSYEDARASGDSALSFPLCAEWLATTVHRLGVDASGNPGFTAGRGFNPAGGAPGGG
ncbi:disease resistance protein [Dorcoceras hygrometricum]|uniref:Disease resistance protein n=1 Tax=Dorcoceras hygrometricum TaxID=472368 RepID=A0A2Z7CZR0_9LAMI|nr:disease resistance protein [Dorcoceras hygrometricum]